MRICQNHAFLFRPRLLLCEKTTSHTFQLITLYNLVGFLEVRILPQCLVTTNSSLVNQVVWSIKLTSKRKEIIIKGEFDRPNSLVYHASNVIMMSFLTKCCVSKFSYFVEYDISYQLSKFQCCRLSGTNFTEERWTPPPLVLHQLKKPSAFWVKDWDWAVGTSPPGSEIGPRSN